MQDVLYELDGALYANITNRCPCDCVFCIRSKGSGVGSSSDLWLERDVTLQDVKNSLENYDLSKFREFVFCGYGEPFCALHLLIQVCKLVRSICDIPIRINTNGLSDLICGQAVSPLLLGLVDTVSISLNASNAQDYLKITRSRFGLASFDSMLDFAKDCAQYVPNVVFTVVDIIGDDEIKKCEDIAYKVGIPLRIRQFVSDSAVGH